MSNTTSMTSRETKPGRGLCTTSRMALCIVLCGLLLGGALSGCGKKGPPGPPEGEASSYTYPQTYPNPASVLPGTEAEESKSRQVPAHAGGITTFPADSRTKTTYGSGAVQ
jgi:hypothetical protein